MAVTNTAAGLSPVSNVCFLEPDTDVCVLAVSQWGETTLLTFSGSDYHLRRYPGEGGTDIQDPSHAQLDCVARDYPQRLGQRSGG